MKVLVLIRDSIIIPILHRQIHLQAHEYYCHKYTTKTPIL